MYLTLPREILRRESTTKTPVRSSTAARTTVDAETRTHLVELLHDADHPLVVTSYLGREEAAVGALETFAETVGVPVVEAAPAFDLNFPRDHPLHFGFAAEPYFDEVDLLVIAHCDVPWVPKRGTPRDDTTIVHIDVDPSKAKYPMWEFPVDITVRADARSVIEDVTEAFDTADIADRTDRFQERGAALHEEWRESVPAPSETDVITPNLLSQTLGEVIDDETIVVDETVTNTPSVLRHCTRTEPGTYYSYCSSGLGWGLGASIGVQLARPDATVVGVVGDGSFVLGNPIAAVQMVEAYELPHLVVIYNNEGWQAVADAIADQYDEVGFDPTAFTQFGPGTDYAALADGWGCHSERVADPAELQGALERALAAVEDGIHAILDVTVADE